MRTKHFYVFFAVIVIFNGVQNSADTLDRNYVFRCYRYVPDYPGLAGKDLTPGKPLEEIVHIEGKLSFALNLFQNYPNPLKPGQGVSGLV